MKKNPLSLLVGHCSLVIVHWSLVSLVLLTAVQPGQAQGSGPLVIIQGAPDTTTAPPEVRTHVSVIDASTAQAIKGLTAEDLQVQEAGTDAGALTVSYEPAGLAIVVVVDRGGISVPRDGRIKEATGLVRELVNRLSVTGADDDIIAIVGVGEEGVLQPEEDFSYNPVDTNLVLNALVAMEGETVSGGTPLYEGLDEALRLLTANTGATIRDVLSHRRKIIVVLSDGLDPNFSDSAREEDIIRKANAADISLYTVGMAQRNRGLSAEDNMVRLAHQTFGLYQLHNDDETHEQVLTLFDHLATQRQQYLVTYQTRQPKGDYTLNIEVDTPIGSAERSVTFSSILEMPEIALTAPAGGAVYTVPYSHTPRVEIPLNVELTFPDGVAREPTAVRYYRSGVLIATSTEAPFAASWDATDYTQTEETARTQESKSEEFTFSAEADDAYLSETTKRSEVNVRVEWEPLPPPTVVEEAESWFITYWWLLLILAALTVGLLVLLVLNIKMKGALAQKVHATTTGVLKSITKQLGATPQRAPGKLVVVQGANTGKEFRLATQRIVVGRDPQFCDFALYDDFISNPHFSIQLEQTQFFITDEGSTNGTKLNGTPLPPRQRMLLQPDAIIEMGQTRLQFKRLGGPTRQLGASQPPAAAPPSPPPVPHPPTQPAPGQPLPPSSPQTAPDGQIPQVRGGATRIVL